MEKAYKLLAEQSGLSNKRAKELIDTGRVSVGGTRIRVARALMPERTHFVVEALEAPSIIYEDDDIIAIDKPAFLESYDLLEEIKRREDDANIVLLNRLDRESSGVILLAKNTSFYKRAVLEYKNNRVFKTYIALVNGMIVEDITLDNYIEVSKGKSARAKVLAPNINYDAKSEARGKDKSEPMCKKDICKENKCKKDTSHAGARGKTKVAKHAISHIHPLEFVGRNTRISMVEVQIETGITHQIRAHLASLNAPIINDAIYNTKRAPSGRLMLHSLETRLLGYTFIAPLPPVFNKMMRRD